MKITNLALNRTQRLENLDHGLNVVYHPDDDTVRSVHEAVNQVFFSEPSAAGEPAEVEILEGGRRLQLRRGTVVDQGRLVATELTAVESNGRRLRESSDEPSDAYDQLTPADIRQLSANLSTANARSVYHPEYGSRAAFDRAVEQAREICEPRNGTPSLHTLLNELEWRDRWTPTARYRELEERRLALISEISDLKHRLASTDYENTETLSRLRSVIADAEQRLQRREQQREDLQEELAIEQRQLAEAEQNSLGSLETWHERRETVQAQIERVRCVVRDIDDRINGYRQQSAPRAELTGSGYLPADLQRRLKQLAANLESAVHRLTQYAMRNQCACREDAERVAERFAALTRCLDEVAGQTTKTTHRDIASHELERLEACRRQLNDHLQQLLQQRNDIDDRLGHATTSRHELEAIQSRVSELLRLLDTIDRQLDDDEAELAREREQLDHLAFHNDGAQRLETELRTAETELVDLERQMRRERELGTTRSEQWLDELRRSATTSELHPLVKDLNRLVRELTGGEYVAVHFPANRRDMEAVSERNESFSTDILSRPTRDLLQTALSLAIANHHAENGHVRTLVLHDAFQHVPASRLRACIDLMLEFTRGPHQVLLLTTHSNVLSLAKSLGISCYDWTQRIKTSAETPRAPSYDTAWDCEEFPGELRDRTNPALRTTSSYATRSQLARQRKSVDTRRPATGSPGPVDRPLPTARTTGESDDRYRSLDRPSNHQPQRPLSETDDDCPSESLRVTGHYLELSDRVTEIPFVPRRISMAMTEHGVWTVANLFHADPLLLSERLHHDDVSAAEIRQWQAQARLMCAVRKLKSYDARILVGCGITTPSQLEELQPQEVYRMVEAFVATSEGSQIVRSGTSVEIERVTRWIRSLQRKNSSLFDAEDDSTTSENGPSRRSTHGRRDSSSRPTRVGRSALPTGGETDDADVEPLAPRDEEETSGTSSRSSHSNSGRSRSSRRSSRSSRSSSASRSSRRSGRTDRESDRQDRSEDGESSAGSRRRTSRRTTRTTRRTRSSRSHDSARESGVLPLKFHLELSSHVEAAPTIGPRMAERLEAVGITTVADLLAADPEEVAEQLDHRRTTAEVVLQWQQQAELVCRIPQIRGHDAQILVACEIVSPEEIAAFDAEELLGIVGPFCDQGEGKRLLRNNKRPDLEEVTEWIAWAKRARQLEAA